MATYKAALKEARSAFDAASHRLDEVTSEADTLKSEISRLRQTITALAALCSDSPALDKLGITEACMEVMENIAYTAATSDVVKALERLGFDIGSHRNVNASVHVVLTRLAAKGKITKVTVVNPQEQSELICWRGGNYDAEVDDIIRNGEMLLRS